MLDHVVNSVESAVPGRSIIGPLLVLLAAILVPQTLQAIADSRGLVASDKVVDTRSNQKAVVVLTVPGTCTLPGCALNVAHGLAGGVEDLRGCA